VFGKLKDLLFGWQRSAQDQKLYQAVKRIVGRSPSNLHVFKLAFLHSSVAKENKDGYRESNERLEYLGDAVLGMIVADYLFKRFPYKDEGFLTEIRSRIVSRESLNNLARKLGIDELVNYDSKRKSASSFKYLYGDAMEAFIGAVFLDKGFHACRDFVVKKMLDEYIDLDEIIVTEQNFKSRLIEWSQRHNKTVRFEMVVEKNNHHHRQFKVELLVDNTSVTFGNGLSKKKAEQDAARRACEILSISVN
jgi:ribonuclease-3